MFELITQRELYGMSTVKRWAVVSVSKQQSVAEHSFNVSVISMAIIEMLEEWGVIDVSPEHKVSIMAYAMLHDITEVYTGDIPSTVKEMSNSASVFLSTVYTPIPNEKWFNSISEGGQPVIKAAVKLADMIDAYIWASMYIDTNHGKKTVIPDVTNRMMRAAGELAQLTGLQPYKIDLLLQRWAHDV